MKSTDTLFAMSVQPYYKLILVSKAQLRHKCVHALDEFLNGYYAASESLKIFVMIDVFLSAETRRKLPTTIKKPR